MGFVNKVWPIKIQCLRHSWALSYDSKHNRVGFSTDLLYVCVAWMPPRSPDLAIFVLTNRQSDRTDCLATPCACVWGNKLKVLKLYESLI